MSRKLQKKEGIIEGDAESLFNLETRIVLCSELEYVLDTVKEALKHDLDPTLVERMKTAETYLKKMML